MIRFFQRIARHFHWLSLLVAIVIDWLIFVKGIFAAVTIVGPFLIALLGGVVAGVAVGLIQWKVAGDTPGKAATKALATMLIVGVPTPTAGTMLMGGGGLIKVASLVAAARKRQQGPAPGGGARRTGR